MKLAILSWVAVLTLLANSPVIIYDPLMLAGVPLAVWGLFLRGARVVSAAWLAAVIAGFHAASAQSGELDARLAGEDLEVVGIVSGLPRENPVLVRFPFRVEQCSGCENLRNLNLSWYRDVRLRPGERWHLTVRLRRPRGSVNPGLFDYEGWLFARDIGATGYVRESASNRRLGRDPWDVPHHQLRYRLQKKIEAAASGSGMPGLLVALTLGESSHISPAQWKVLSDTGTNHLFIISGLHVGLVTAATYRLALFVLARRTAAVVSLVLAMLYGVIAGLGLPVQRALIMSSVAIIGATMRRNVSVWDLYCYALLGVTLIDPLAMLSTGFWLSFGAVFSLLYVFAGRERREQRGWRDWLFTAIATQWVVFVGMLPWLLWLVFQVSLVSFLVNLVVIPWISIFVVPPLLLAMMIGWTSDFLFTLLVGFAHACLEPAWQLLTWVASKRLVFFASAMELPCLLLGILGTVILLLPRGFLPRWPGAVLMLPLFTLTPDLPAEGEMDVTVLDVGQGLSVLMRTRHGAVLYDAGPRFGERFDAGAQIVVPTVRRSGASHIDAFVVSHPDMDHAGGADAVLTNLPTYRVYSSERRPPPGAIYCNRDVSWVLDGVHFRMIRLDRPEGKTNNRSCVVLVTSETFSMLLPGDIERSVEMNLIDKIPTNIDVMLAPHHGSGTSSSPGLLNHVMADTIIVSAGYRNRFNHPDPAVKRRYAARNAKVLSTAEEGAITIRLRRGKMEIVSARKRYRRYWHD